MTTPGVRYNQAQFEVAVKIVQHLPKEGPVQPSQEDQLQFYGLYKQAELGDINTSRPGMLEFINKAKWDAWNAKKGMSREEARHQYVKKLLEVLKKVQPKGDEVEKYIKRIEGA